MRCIGLTDEAIQALPDHRRTDAIENAKHTSHHEFLSFKFISAIRASRSKTACQKSWLTRRTACNRPPCGVVFTFTLSVPPTTLRMPVGCKKYLRLIPADSMPASVAIEQSPRPPAFLGRIPSELAAGWAS